jgi:hypothetical protein
MRVKQFGAVFPELAARQMLFFWLSPQTRAPITCYSLLEYYCEEPACDCRRVTLDVVSPELPGRIFASIGFGWETSDFYKKWGQARGLLGPCKLRNGVLDPSELNCDWADLLLRHIRRNILRNPKQVALFRRHYELMKREQKKQL